MVGFNTIVMGKASATIRYIRKSFITVWSHARWRGCARWRNPRHVAATYRFHQLEVHARMPRRSATVRLPPPDRCRLIAAAQAAGRSIHNSPLVSPGWWSCRNREAHQSHDASRASPLPRTGCTVKRDSSSSTRAFWNAFRPVAEQCAPFPTAWRSVFPPRGRCRAPVPKGRHEP